METPSDTTASEQASAPSTGDAKLRQTTQMRNAARQALLDVEQERQAPRLRVKARAEHAAQVTPEALGVHDALPDHHVFNTFAESRAKIAQSVQARFGQISQALASSHLDSTQAVTKVAELARDSLARHIPQIDELRQRLQGINESIEDRKQKAMQPPPHLAGMMQSARDALRVMPAEERMALIARHQGDDTGDVLLYAIGGSPAFLTGVPEGKQMEMRTALLGIRDPDLLMLEPGMRQALAAVDKMQAGLARLIGDVADLDAAEALAALRAGSGKA